MLFLLLLLSWLVFFVKDERKVCVCVCFCFCFCFLLIEVDSSLQQISLGFVEMHFDTTATSHDDVDQ